jgi:hypothetical protein
LTSTSISKFADFKVGVASGIGSGPTSTSYTTASDNSSTIKKEDFKLNSSGKGL